MTLKFAVLSVLLIWISVIDYRSLIIPDSLLLAGALIYIPLSVLEGSSFIQITAALLSGCAVSVPLLLFVLLADAVTGKETMGFGDIKLFFLIGIYLSAAETWLTLFLSCVVGLVWYYLYWNKKETVMPFGPSIAAAAMIAVIWGEPVLNWYSGFFV